MITLMYITNKPELALIAQQAGVDRIWIDLETLGKEERQAGMDTVKSKHSVEDIKRIKPLLNKSELMVRVNPLNPNSKKEIDDVIDAGTQYIMLPMYENKEDVETFIKMVNGRAKIMLLLETINAEKNLDSYLDVKGIDEIHIGLNDLHLQYGNKFMFELLANGKVEEITKKIKVKGIKFGFGGFARVGYGILPAEKIITEHYSYGSTLGILSRGFCNANNIFDPDSIRQDFITGIKMIREKENEIKQYKLQDFEKNHEEVKEIVASIVEGIK